MNLIKTLRRKRWPAGARRFDIFRSFTIDTGTQESFRSSNYIAQLKYIKKKMVI